MEKVKGVNVGVITPYNAQVECIREVGVRKEIKGWEEVEVSTVDGFQGREKDAILISMVRCNKKKQVG